MPPSKSCLRFEAPHFCAGVLVEDGRVVRTAPIVKYMRGWYAADAIGYANRKRWRTSVIKEGTTRCRWWVDSHPSTKEES